MKTFTEDEIKELQTLNERGPVGNERIGAMMAYLYKHGIRYWDGPGGISFPLHGYMCHALVLSHVVRQFELVMRKQAALV